MVSCGSRLRCSVDQAPPPTPPPNPPVCPLMIARNIASTSPLVGKSCQSITDQYSMCEKILHFVNRTSCFNPLLSPYPSVDNHGVYFHSPPLLVSGAKYLYYFMPDLRALFTNKPIALFEVAYNVFLH
ncbi:hypothetical protein O6H91_08G051500 [Diphasiastrum complanatum]|uniref:Uncharacterized protein n=1 Tax=Diphasiastrum complanatum TaxID=34168 RepID=A0ACC2CXE7_DIPCM|nr:hypothetical protein O6H91_08G051500 [Diphasiastrum complanatum]